MQPIYMFLLFFWPLCYTPISKEKYFGVKRNYRSKEAFWGFFSFIQDNSHSCNASGCFSLKHYSNSQHLRRVSLL